jgi:hypothetical protein
LIPVRRGGPPRQIELGQPEGGDFQYKGKVNGGNSGRIRPFGAIVMSASFAVGRRTWEDGAMSPKRLSNLLIALTVAAGLLSAPFAAPAVAKAHHAAGGEMQAGMQAMADDAHAMHGDMHAMSGTHAMADGMPCCPDEGAPARDCDSCPLMALCSVSISFPTPSGAAVLVPALTGQAAFALPDDLLTDGLSARPPDHPPRTTV